MVIIGCELTNKMLDGLFTVFQVLELAANIFKQIPEDIDYEGTVKIFENDHSPINVVLLQEVTY